MDDRWLKNRRARHESWFIFAVLLGVAAFTIADIASDIGEGSSYLHTAGEAGVVILALFGAFLLWRRILSLRTEVLNQTQIAEQVTLEKRAALIEAEKWRAEASQVLKGLSDAIDAQLSRWALSKSEKEVALLLLKGLSLKEIAEVRGVSDKTARAQSFAVYSKSGLSGRAELSAFFLEDLMLPPTSGPTMTATPSERSRLDLSY